MSEELWTHFLTFPGVPVGAPHESEHTTECPADNILQEGAVWTHFHFHFFPV